MRVVDSFCLCLFASCQLCGTHTYVHTLFSTWALAVDFSCCSSQREPLWVNWRRCFYRPYALPVFQSSETALKFNRYCKWIFDCRKICFWFVACYVDVFVLIVLTGDMASHTLLPAGDDDSLGDDGTSSRCWALFIIQSVVFVTARLAIIIRVFCFPWCCWLLYIDHSLLHPIVNYCCKNSSSFGKHQLPDQIQCKILGSSELL